MIIVIVVITIGLVSSVVVVVVIIIIVVIIFISAIMITRIESDSRVIGGQSSRVCLLARIIIIVQINLEVKAVSRPTCEQSLSAVDLVGLL